MEHALLIYLLIKLNLSLEELMQSSFSSQNNLDRQEKS